MHTHAQTLLYVLAHTNAQTNILFSMHLSTDPTGTCTKGVTHTHRTHTCAQTHASKHTDTKTQTQPQTYHKLKPTNEMSGIRTCMY